MKFKYKITIIILLIIVALAYLIFGFINWQKRQDAKMASCEYLDENRYGVSIDPINFIDCFDIFSIEQESLLYQNNRMNLYYIRDDKHDYNISMLNTLKNYKIDNGFMYIYEPLIFPESEYARIQFGDKPWQFPQKFFINGEVKEINYKSPQEFPNYIQVEMTTGEVTLYNTYDQIPDEVKNIFKSLEQ